MSRRYLLVSHIPFARFNNAIIVDQLWANDLAELTSHVGPIHLAVPEVPIEEANTTWGPKAISLDPSLPITFVPLPPLYYSWEWWKVCKIRKILKREVELADLVHSSNLFNPYLSLLYAHFLAARLGKKTVFVVAEDYHDSLIWEWVRLSKNSMQRWRRNLVVKHMDNLMQKAAAVASLTLLFTPAAVQRFRLYATNGIAARDTTHTEKNIIKEDTFEAKCQAILSGAPLKLVAACRHKPLKGLEFAIRAVAALKQRDIYVEAKLYGHGPLTPELIRLTRYLGVDDRVYFPGSLSADQEVFKALADSHISLMPHRTNEFARALYDALAGGTPVLAFGTAASEGSIRNGIDGLLVALDNPIALSVGIEYLHRHRSELVTLSRNARDRSFLETRSIWHKFRADRINELFYEEPRL